MAREGWATWGNEAIEGKYLPNSCPIGRVFYTECYAGLKLKVTAIGHLNELPLWECECTDEECKRIKDDQSPFNLYLRLHQVIQEIESATRGLRLCHKKYGQEVKQASTFSCQIGIQKLYPELIEAINELNKIYSKIEADGKQIKLFEDERR